MQGCARCAFLRGEGLSSEAVGCGHLGSLSVHTQIRRGSWHDRAVGGAAAELWTLRQSNCPQAVHTLSTGCPHSDPLSF